MNLETKVQLLTGVGPKTVQKLERLGINSVRDLLFNWPRTWQDFSSPRDISSLRINDEAIIKAKIKSVKEIRTRNRWMSIIEANLVDDKNYEIKAIWFNQTFLKSVLRVDDEWLFLGKIGWDFKAKQKTLAVSQMEKEAVILPVYSETPGITSKFLRKLIKPILSEIDAIIDDYLPDEIRGFLLDLRTTLKYIHFPNSNESLAKAKNRLAFDELFLIALRFLTIKKELQQNVAPPMQIDEKVLQNFTKKLPFKLTDAQRKVAWEIIQDLAKNVPMNRLLEGDVGSGKTVVAAMAVLVAAKNNLQTVWLAPTEILANQHYQNIKPLIHLVGVSTGLYTSANKIADTQKDDLIIGTHAVLQKNVSFPNLGLIIIDEQHRFGVKQRAHLRKPILTSTFRQAVSMEKVTIPHLLSMTATPIPRTLALALYGDLDLSIIDQMPAGRQTIITKIINEKNRQKTYDFIRSEIKNGRQAFVICPLIETGEVTTGKLFDTDRKSVMEEYKKLSEQIFPEFKIGFLHGKMKSKEKEAVMNSFHERELSILVSTAVVEVGIDVPNATVMMIESADRFGLAQLHQFRGRVGRGKHQSYCFLLSDLRSEKSAQRLKAMEDCFDGFKLAQIDLELRGSGEVVGLKQSGLDNLKMASLSDTILIGEARAAAQKIVEDGIEKYPLLCAKLKEFEIEKHLE